MRDALVFPATVRHELCGVLHEVGGILGEIPCLATAESNTVSLAREHTSLVGYYAYALY